MHISKLKRMAAVVGVAIFFSGALPAAAESASGRVGTALEQMRSWTGPSENGQAWQRFLRSDDLAQQLQHGDQADQQIVAEILGRYHSGAAGLDRRQFEAVRAALDAWADELGIPASLRLAAAAKSAKAAFRPIDEQQLGRSRDELRRQVAALDRFLEIGGTEKARGWKQYLRWEALQAQLEPGAPVDMQVLQKISARFFSGADGLEYAPCVATREALRRYGGLLTSQQDAKLRERFVKQLSALADSLGAYAKEPTTATARQINARLDGLQQCGQVPALISSVRQELSRPNFLVMASAEFVAAGIQSDVDDTMKLSDSILGTRIHGTGHTVGRIDAQLVADADQAALDVVLTGTTASDTVGYNGPVTIFSDGLTSLDGRKRLLIDAAGLHAQPATACCRTSTIIKCISAGSRIGSSLIEKIAWRKAGQQKPQAERIAAGRAAQRLSRRMDEESGEFLADANRSFRKEFRRPLERRNAFPRSLRFRSTSDRLSVTALQAGPSQLAAPGAPPELNGGHQLAVRMHESLVNNTAELALAGVTLTDERLAEIVKEISGEVPDELKISPDKDPWSITFAWQQPVTVTFDEQRMTVAVRGRKFTRGDQPLNKLMEISASYQLEKTDQGSKLTRQGEIDVVYPGREGQRLGVREVTFKTFMRKKFEAMFKPEIVREGLPLPGAGKRPGRSSCNSWRPAEGG